MTRLILVRHGHVEGISPERFRGRADLPLTGLGQRQAAATGARVRRTWRPAAVYSSPLGRCLATASAIADPLGLPVVRTEGLADIDYGRWQGLTRDEARVRWAAEVDAWYRTPHLTAMPDGESLPDVAARTAAVLRDVIRQHADDTVALVGHDSVNRVILLQALDLPLSRYWHLKQAPCAINELTVEHGEFTLVSMNDTAHLLNV